uniref:Uncharacterized protein n=1 Tax=Amphimedon queenslandica TaxID=400682 RepID=A0A1X7SY67_AMPQE
MKGIGNFRSRQEMLVTHTMIISLFIGIFSILQ